MNHSIPDQDPDDVRLARALYPRVAQRWCFWFKDIGAWGECIERWAGSETRYCWTDDGEVWTPIPPYGADEAPAWDALRRYCERRGLYFQIEYVPPSEGCPAERAVTIQRLGGIRRAVAEGSTFALAARAAMLDMEAQDGR